MVAFSISAVFRSSVILNPLNILQLYRWNNHIFIQVFSIPKNRMAFKYKWKKLSKTADNGFVDIFFVPLSRCIFSRCNLVNVSVSWQQTSDTSLLSWSHHVPADCSWCQLSLKAEERILPAHFSLKYWVSVLWGFKYFKQSPKSSKRIFYKDTANLSY